MGRKKKKKIKSRPQKGKLQIVAKEKSLEKKPIKFWNRLLTSIAILSGIVAIISSWNTIVSLFKSDKTKYDDEYFVQGELKPNKLNLDTTKSNDSKLNFNTEGIVDTFPRIEGIFIKDFLKKNVIKFKIGGVKFGFSPMQLYSGVELINGFVKWGEGFRISAGVKNDRVYVSLEIKDLKNEEVIGNIEYNHWKLYKPNLLEFNNDDYRLQVKDKQNNIALALEFNRDDQTPEISLSGYFWGSTSVLVIPSTGSPVSFYTSDNNWKQNAKNEISKIKSIF